MITLFQRYYSLVWAIWFLVEPIQENWRVWLSPTIGTMIMAYLLARLIRSKPRRYFWCWNGAAAFGLMSFLVPKEFKIDHTLVYGGWWLMLFLATLPPSSGKRRKQLLERLQKLRRTWAVGIPLPS